MMGKKKLLIVTNWYPNKKDPNYGIFIKNQATLLNEIYEVHILLFSNRILFKETSYYDDGILIHHKSEPWLPKTNTFSYNYWARRVAKYIGKLDLKFDYSIIHAHDYQPALACYQYFLISGARYYTTIHNTDFLENKIDDFLHQLIKPALQNSTCVVSVGKKLNSYLNDKYELDNTTIIPNFIDTNLFTLGSKANDKTIFLLVGYLSRVKGTKEVINAFLSTKTTNAELHLVGINKLEPGYLETVLEVNQNIKYLGVKDNHLMPQIYQQSTCLISYSEVETFGITVIEAMSCGLPVIFKPSGGPEDLVPSFAGLKVYDSSSLAAAIKKTTEHKKEYDSTLIRNNTIAFYSAKTILKQIIKTYNDS